MALVATLALLLGFYARSYFPGWNSGGGHANQHGLAIYAPGTPEASNAPSDSPAADTSDQVLVDVAVPAELFANSQPDGDRLSFWFTQAVVPANTTDTWAANLRTGYPGVEMQYILDGTITVTIEGSVQVIRADSAGTTEQPIAGTDIVLGPATPLSIVSHQPSFWNDWKVTGQTPGWISWPKVSGQPIRQNRGTTMPTFIPTAKDRYRTGHPQIKALK